MLLNKYIRKVRSVELHKLISMGMVLVLTNSATANNASSHHDDDRDIVAAAIALNLHPSYKKQPHRQPVRHYGSNQQLKNNSIWHRVKQGFQLRNDQYRPRVKQAVKYFQRHPARLNRVLNRSSDYLHFVVTELHKRRMPTDLVLLPMVESAYQNKAVSHAGAVGMWQFISETGRRYGLKQTRGYDGRMDVIESTRAAMDYLQKLHREFKGDWLLALAAYNSGENRVHREIRKNRARGLPTDYWSLSLPKETRSYVPLLLAYREVIRQPHQFGVRLPAVANSPKLVSAHINKSVDLRKVAHIAGIDPSILTSLNPGYKYGVTMPKLAKRIVLPRQYAGNLLRAIQVAPMIDERRVRQYAKVKTSKYRKRSRRSKRSSRRGKRHHRVRSGDNLTTIASRYGTTVRRLMRLNRMRSTRLRVGKRLRVT